MTNYNYPPFKAKNAESEMSHLFNAKSFSRYNQQSVASTTTLRSPSFLNSDSKSSTSTSKKTNDLLFERVLFTEKKRQADQENDMKQEQAVNRNETFNKSYLQFNSPFVIDDEDADLLQPFSQLNKNGSNHKSGDKFNSKASYSMNLAQSANNLNDEVLEIQRKNPFIIVNESSKTNLNTLNTKKQNLSKEKIFSSRNSENANTSDNENILTGIFNYEGVTVDLELTNKLLKWRSISGKKDVLVFKQKKNRIKYLLFDF